MIRLGAGDGRWSSWDLERIRRMALRVALAAVVLCVLGFFISREHLFRAYLYAYLFWLGITLGCLAVLMLQHLTGGGWGLVIRRPLEAGTRMLPLMALLFIPVLLGMQDLYVWARPGAAEADPGIARKQPYLNVPWFVVRAAVCFAVWLVLAWLLNRWSEDQDRTGDPRATQRLRTLSGPGLVAYVLAMSVAAVDWVMSIDPHWYSTMFPVIFIVGQGLGAMAAMIVVLAVLRDREPMAGLVGRDQFHDLGNLLMAFVMLWAYVQFSQFLIIWMANLAEETPFYVVRLADAVQYVSLALVLLHFAVPFVLLLSRDTKRSAQTLAAVAAGILLMRLVDLWWIVMPMYAQRHAEAAEAGTERHAGVGLHWLDLVTPIGLGAIWLAVYARELLRRPLLPAHDTRLEALEHATGGRHG